MRILMNGISMQGKKTGVGHYTAELVRCLRPMLGKQNLELYSMSRFMQAIHFLHRLRHSLRNQPASSPSADPSAKVGTPVKLSPMRRLQKWLGSHLRAITKMAQQRQLQRINSYDLYHEPNFLPLEIDLPTVTTVCDLSVLLHPEWHPAERVAEHERNFKRGLARTQHVIAISEFARQEIIHHLGWAPDRVSRTYMGVRPGLQPMTQAKIEAGRRALQLPPRYLLYLGTIEPRKNLMNLFRAYCGLPGSVREKFPLILVGSWGWNSSDIATFLHDEARHRGVIYLGYLPDNATCLLYNAARALVFPSRYEGFGLPPVEMMACSGAVLASTAGAIVETVGRKAHLTDPDDIDGWRQALLRVCTEDDWWQTLRKGSVEIAQPFTWERCAADTMSVYHSVVYGQKPALKAA